MEEAKVYFIGRSEEKGAGWVENIGVSLRKENSVSLGPVGSDFAPGQAGSEAHWVLAEQI